MDWMVSVGDSSVSTLAWLAALAAGFGLLARWMPCNPGMYWWKDWQAALTDLLYWFVVPLLWTLFRVVLLAAGVALVLGGRSPQRAFFCSWPVWQQCLAILLIQDVLLYWIHRGFHTRWAWHFHAIHHSPRVLDWMSMPRFHPVNLLAMSLAVVVVLLIGFAPAALLALAPFNLLYSSMVHANLSWTFGPLRYVLASPVFHRWHHTSQAEGHNKNLAPTFPWLDLLFGTFYMPAGKLPEQFGKGQDDFPEDFWGQLLYPFRQERLPSAAARGPGSGEKAA
jgi:sterol desaturase/sphingolipid hydroxylase (fatty acid hydroxylase superfamily)